MTKRGMSEAGGSRGVEREVTRGVEREVTRAAGDSAPMSGPGAYPRLASLISSGRAEIVARKIVSIAERPVCAPIEGALGFLATTLLALEAGMLPPRLACREMPVVPPRLTGAVTLPPGARSLIGEAANLFIEADRLDEAAVLFAALGALTPDCAAGGLGLCAVHLCRDELDAALAAAEWAGDAEPDEPAVQASVSRIVHDLFARMGATRSSERERSSSMTSAEPGHMRSSMQATAGAMA